MKEANTLTRKEGRSRQPNAQSRDRKAGPSGAGAGAQKTAHPGGRPRGETGQGARMQLQLYHRALENRQEKSIPDAVSAQELRSKVRVPGALGSLSLVGGGVTVDE